MTDLSRDRFLTYLAAKKAVDDRSINKKVWETVRQSITSSQPDGPVGLKRGAESAR